MTDVNDNRPEFLQDTYIASVSEQYTVGASFLTVRSTNISQRGFSPFVYRDRGGWPASLPYIRKIRISVAIGNQSRIRLHERVPMVKIWGS